MSGGLFTLVDAHNLLYQDRELRPLMEQPETAHQELERLCAGQRGILLFYDGGPGGRHQVTHRHGIRIEYTGVGDADDRIVAWLQLHPGIGAVVVSDDRELRTRARNLGARLADPGGFIAALRQRQKRRQGAPAEKPEPNNSEVEMWLKLFSAPPNDSKDL